MRCAAIRFYNLSCTCRHFGVGRRKRVRDLINSEANPTTSWGIGNAHEIKSRQWSCKNCYQTEAKQSIKLKICWRFNLTLTHAAGTYYTHGIGLYRYGIVWYIRRADWLTDDDGDGGVTGFWLLLRLLFSFLLSYLPPPASLLAFFWTLPPL